MTLKLDEKYVYSRSGKAYLRRAPRSIGQIHELRLPFVKRVMARGRPYFYFVAPGRVTKARLPDPATPGFAHAYLNELARLEGEPTEQYDRKSEFVYFIGCDEAVKIGTSINVSRRFDAIQSTSPIPLRILAMIPGGQSLERLYHSRFAEHRLHGEWFAAHPDILEEVGRLLNGTETQDARNA